MSTAQPTAFWRRHTGIWLVAGIYLFLGELLAPTVLQRVAHDIGLQAFHDPDPQRLLIKMAPVDFVLGFIGQMAAIMASVGVFRLALADLDDRDRTYSVLVQDLPQWLRFTGPAAVMTAIDIVYAYAYNLFVPPSPVFGISFMAAQVLAAVPLAFVFPMMLDEGCTFLDAARKSARLCVPKFGTVLFWMAGFAILSWLGLVAIIIGVIATLPHYQFGMADLYRRIRGVVPS